jgi:hypothetical protein
MLGGFNPVGWKGILNMTIGRDRLIVAVPRLTAFKLVYILADQIGFNTVASNKRQGFLEDFQFTQTGKFIEHQQKPVLIVRNRLAILKIKPVCQCPHNHIHHDANQWP